MKKSLLVIACAVVFLLISTAVFAQNDITNLYSPSFLAAGETSAGLSSPYADLLNPAASGGVQRSVFDINYIGLAGLGSTSGWGNIVNSGLTIPTPVGVFTGSAHYIDSTFPALNIGSMGMFSLSFSKDLYPKLYVGAGLNLAIGSDWGLGLDLGFINLPGDLWILKDFRWGVALRNLGKGYASPGGALAAGVGTVPPAFTPAVGASFKVLKTPDFSLQFDPGLSFPSFQDVRLTLGTGFTYQDLLHVNASYVMDLVDILKGTARNIPFNFGVSVNLKTDIKKNINFLGITRNRWNTSTVRLSTAVAPLQNGVWAGGLGAGLILGKHDRTPPVIVIDPPPYISPNGDGILDDLPVSLKISDRRYIEGYKLVIENSQGKAVRTIGGSYTGPKSSGFRNFLDRLFAVKKSIPVPDKIVWDGRDTGGLVVPDGTYHYYVEAWDDNGNVGKSKVETVIVDDTAPDVTVSMPYNQFSPNGDGKKDILIIDQQGSPEDLWKGEFVNAAGKAVRYIEWNTGRPTGFTWDGKDGNGAVLPDGVYTYRISSTDRAGNTGSAELKNIVLNTQATPVNLTMDNTAFSPNGDGIRDDVTFTLDVPVRNGIERWSLVIKDTNGRAVRSYTGTTEIPAT
ncbi:MAG: hypothetical protein GXP46_08380, partial [Deferribacteres bacterium]|nr:hypothetical protein [Deferribacteres bacterium]